MAAAIEQPYTVLIELIKIAESHGTTTVGSRHVEGVQKTVFSTFPKIFYSKEGKARGIDPNVHNRYQTLINQLKDKLALGDKFQTPSGISVFSPPATKDGTPINPDLRYIQMRFGKEQRIIGCIYVVVKSRNALLGNFSANIYWDCCWHGAGRGRFDPGSLELLV